MAIKPSIPDWRPEGNKPVEAVVNEGEILEIQTIITSISISNKQTNIMMINDEVTSEEALQNL